MLASGAAAKQPREAENAARKSPWGLNPLKTSQQALSFLSFQAPLTSVLSQDTPQMTSSCSFFALLWTRKQVEAVGKMQRA